MLNNAIRLDELWKQFTFPFPAIIRNLFCAGIFLFFVQMFCFDIKAQWSLQTSGTANNLFSIHFINTNIGWAVGGNNTILQTVNGGTTWSPVAGPGGLPTSSYLGVRFIDSNTGWVGGGSVVLRTADGGTMWTSQTNGTTQTLRRVFFIGSSNDFVTGFAGTILKNAGPTVSRLTIRGRVTDNSGRGISKATITLSGGFNSEQRTALTNPFGYFFFESVEAGSSYIITASRKGFIFTPEYHVFTLNDLRNDLNFTVVES